jgi:hypothetical protein
MINRNLLLNSENSGYIDTAGPHSPADGAGHWKALCDPQSFPVAPASDGLLKAERTRLGAAHEMRARLATYGVAGYPGGGSCCCNEPTAESSAFLLLLASLPMIARNSGLSPEGAFIGFTDMSLPKVERRPKRCTRGPSKITKARIERAIKGTLASGQPVAGVDFYDPQNGKFRVIVGQPDRASTPTEDPNEWDEVRIDAANKKRLA